MALDIPLYIIAVVLGLCNLFAYNSFLASPTYLQHYSQYAAVKDTDDVSTLPEPTMTEFWDSVATWVTVLQAVPMLIGQGLSLTPFMLRVNAQIRITAGAVFLLVCMLLIPVCAANGGISEGGAMAILIITCFCSGLATSVLQSALYFLFGPLPSIYMSGFVLGGGFSGSVNSVIRILISVGMEPTFWGVKSGAVIFFSISMGLMVVTIGTLFFLRRNAIVKQYCRAFLMHPDKEAPREAPVDTAELDMMDKVEEGEKREGQPEDPVVTYSPKNEQGKVEGHEPSEAVAVGEGPLEETDEPASAIEVVKKIWFMMLNVAVCMLTTLTLFPGIGLSAMYEDLNPVTTAAPGSSEEHVKQSGWGDDDLMPIIVVMCYNVGDTVGRLIINFKRTWVPPRWVPVIVIARIVVCVIPLVLGAIPSKVINSNANPIVIMCVLGVTNGYLTGVTMAYGSGSPKLKTQSERSVAGACMSFSLLTGITLGCVVSILAMTLSLNK